MIDDGATCPGAGACESGQCVCPAASFCGGTCVDTTKDIAHCGACNTPCPVGATCESGECRCPGGTSLCGGTCINLMTDHAHCGSCSTGCTPLEECSGGLCQCAHVQCGGQCTKLDDDPQNCGRCGRDCRGAECTEGVCGAIQVLDDQVSALAMDGSKMYWYSWVHQGIRSANVDGSGAVTVCASPYDPDTIAVHGSTVYWADTYATWMAPVDGSAAATRVNTRGAYALAFDASYVYYSAGYLSDAGVYRANLDGTGETLLASTVATPHDLLLAGGFLYWSEETISYSLPGGYRTSVNRMAPDGSSRVALATSSLLDDISIYQAPGTLRMDSGRLYFTGYYGQAGLFSADLDGGDRRLLASAMPRHLVVSSASLYWVSNSTTLSSMPKEGGPITSILKTDQNCWIRALAEDTDFIWFATDCSGIWKVAK